MAQPSQHDREALLELLLALGGPLMWTGPVPYDALAAQRTAEQSESSGEPAEAGPPSGSPTPGGGTRAGRGRHAA
jgi:hypothetical protein